MTESFLKPNAKTAFLKLFSSSVPPINRLCISGIGLYTGSFFDCICDFSVFDF